MQKPPTVRRNARPITSFVVAGLMTVSGPMSLFLTTQAAHAQPAADDNPEVIAQAKEHYKAGLAAYQAGKYDVAIRELKKAYAAKRLAPLLLNIGATYRKIGDLDLSLHFYQKYLDEAPTDARDRPEVEKIIAELKVAKAAQATDDNTGTGVAEVPQPRESRRAGGEWKHVVIDAAPPETPIDVRVSTPPMKGVKVFVYFRSAGQADFSSVLMKRRGQEKVGRIPAESVTGRSLQYYIEAKDASGTVVKSAGDSGNPNIIMLEEGVKPVLLASSRRDDDAEEASEEDTRPKRRVRNDDDSVPGGANLNERPGTSRRRDKAAGGLTDLQKAGIGLLAGGVLFTGIGGALVGISKHEQDVLVGDSKNSTAKAPIYWNNDPNFNGTQEKAHDATARTENHAGIAVLSIGLIGAVAGAGCLVADAVTRTDDGHHGKKKSKKKHRVVEDEEETSNWYVAPSLGPSVAGVTGGFTF